MNETIVGTAPYPSQDQYLGDGGRATVAPRRQDRIPAGPAGGSTQNRRRRRRPGTGYFAGEGAAEHEAGAVTVSTHSIARGGVVQLARWGLVDAVPGSGAPAVSEVTFRSGDVAVTRAGQGPLRCRSARRVEAVRPRRSTARRRRRRGRPRGEGGDGDRCAPGGDRPGDRHPHPGVRRDRRALRRGHRRGAVPHGPIGSAPTLSTPSRPTRRPSTSTSAGCRGGATSSTSPPTRSPGVPHPRRRGVRLAVPAHDRAGLGTVRRGRAGDGAARARGHRRRPAPQETHLSQPERFRPCAAPSGRPGPTVVDRHTAANDEPTATSSVLPHYALWSLVIIAVDVLRIGCASPRQPGECAIPSEEAVNSART